MAVHVLYFWREPEAELSRVHAALQPDGSLALAYRLRNDMPPVSQRQFPAEGHRLYSSDEEVLMLFRAAGFDDPRCVVEERAPAEGSAGRLVIATA